MAKATQAGGNHNQIQNTHLKVAQTVDGAVIAVSVLRQAHGLQQQLDSELRVAMLTSHSPPQIGFPLTLRSERLEADPCRIYCPSINLLAAAIISGEVFKTPDM